VTDFGLMTDVELTVTVVHALKKNMIQVQE
jgi:hypothetical protein